MQTSKVPVSGDPAPELLRDHSLAYLCRRCNWRGDPLNNGVFEIFCEETLKPVVVLCFLLQYALLAVMGAYVLVKRES